MDSSPEGLSGFRRWMKVVGLLNRAHHAQLNRTWYRCTNRSSRVNGVGNGLSILSLHDAWAALYL
jgi:hypothetical protein